MRAVRFHEHGGTDVLRVDDDVDRPDPAPGEVVVSVRSAGVNPVDTYFREGSYRPFTLPMIPGVDVAGEAVAVGDGVTGFAEGDPVFGTGLGKDHYGAYAEYVAVPTDRLARLPEGANLERMGGAGVAGVTAWRGLIDKASLEPAETVLIHGGSGGVGHAAVQIAASAGARVVTTASPSYHDRLAELGADAALDYGRDDLADAVREAGGGGVDVVLDHRLDDYCQFDAEVANPGASVVGIGENSPEVGFSDDGPARSKDVTYRFMSMFNTPDMSVPLRRLGGLVEAGDFEVDVARTYSLDEAAEAQRVVMEESFLGKLVLTP